MRTAVIDVQTGRVVNVIERGVQPENSRVEEATNPPEGFVWAEHPTAAPGWSYADGVLLPPERDLADLKAAARLSMNQQRDAAINAGVTFGGVVYDSDAESRAALNATLTVFGPIGEVPEGFTWRAADNTDHALTFQQLHGLAAAMLEHGYAQHVKARALKDAIEAAATLAEVNAITWEP